MRLIGGGLRTCLQLYAMQRTLRGVYDHDRIYEYIMSEARRVIVIGIETHQHNDCGDFSLPTKPEISACSAAPMRRRQVSQALTLLTGLHHPWALDLSEFLQRLSQMVAAQLALRTSTGVVHREEARESCHRPVLRDLERPFALWVVGEEVSQEILSQQPFC